jgi:adenylate cyclase
VNKFEGDAALCVFGAPGDQPDHPLRALRAARDLRRRIAKLHERHPDLDAGIGIATGKAVAGNVGAADRFEYTVIGVPVNLAARLTEEAKHCDGRVLALADSVESADTEARHWRAAGSVSLRGVRDPVPVCEPVA